MGGTRYKLRPPRHGRSLCRRRGTDIAMQIAMADFDTIAKHLIQTYPADFARFALQRDDIQKVEVLESEQPSTRRPDSLLRVELADRKVLVHHEFQTTDHPAMPRRMAEYIGRFIGKHGLPVHSHVLYLRPDAGRRDPGYYRQAQPGYQIFVQYKVVRLRQLPGQAVLAGGGAGLAAVCAVDAAADRAGRGGVVRAVHCPGGGLATGAVGQGRICRGTGPVEQLGV